MQNVCNNRVKNNIGFSIIEVIVVISIIAFLSSVIFTSLHKARIRARDIARIQNARQISLALEQYEQSNNTYKVSNAGLASNPGSGYVSKTGDDYSTSILTALNQSGYLSNSYLNDPVFGTENYYLGVCTSTNGYNIFVKLEQPEYDLSTSSIETTCGGAEASNLGFSFIASTAGGSSGGGGGVGGYSGASEISSGVGSETPRVLSGNIKYTNVSNSQMHNVTVTLKQAGITKYTATTPASGNGDYLFPSVVEGVYDVYLTKPEARAGGVNATDAGSLNSWLIDTSVNPGRLYFLAADVYQNSPSIVITSADATEIQSHYVLGSPIFPMGYWVFAKTESENIPYSSYPIPYANSGGFSNMTLTILGSDLVQNFSCVAYGDMNRSLVPP